MTAPGETSSKLLLFGATGDLARRMLLPSLYALHADGLVPDELQIIGTARSEMSDEEFRQMARDALEEHLPEDRKDPKALESFPERLSYQALDASTIAVSSHIQPLHSPYRNSDRASRCLRLPVGWLDSSFR